MRVAQIFVPNEFESGPDEPNIVVTREFDQPSDDAQLKFITWAQGGCFVSWVLPQGLKNSLLEVIDCQTP